VNLELCTFSNNRDTSGTYGGGAIHVHDSGTAVNIYGSSFNGNTADSGKGDDIYNKDNLSTVTIHNTCPSPYSSNTPIQGKTILKAFNPRFNQDSLIKHPSQRFSSINIWKHCRSSSVFHCVCAATLRCNKLSF
jgi:hypothetical protein